MAKSSASFDVAYIRSGAGNYQPGERFGPRVLPDYELVWVTTGSALYHHDGLQITLAPGDVLLARPGFKEYYDWDPKKQSRHLFLHFNITSRPRDWQEEKSWAVLCPPQHTAPVRTLFRLLLDQIQHQAPTRGTRQTPEPRCQRWLGAAIDLFALPAVSLAKTQQHVLDDSVQRALKAICAHLDYSADKKIILDDLAAAAHVSSAHLIRLFRTQLGSTPMQAVRLARLDRCVPLLERSNLTIAEIAYRCGFASPYHFSRRFHEQFGLPPTSLRKKLRQGGPRPPLAMPLKPPGAYYDNAM